MLSQAGNEKKPLPLGGISLHFAKAIGNYIMIFSMKTTNNRIEDDFFIHLGRDPYFSVELDINLGPLNLLVHLLSLNPIQPGLDLNYEGLKYTHKFQSNWNGASKIPHMW